MRENQHLICFGPLGMQIFDEGKASEKQTPFREINPEVQQWRLGKRETNPRSLVDVKWFEVIFFDAGITNEPRANEIRFGITPRLS